MHLKVCYNRYSWGAGKQGSEYTSILWFRQLKCIKSISRIGLKMEAGNCPLLNINAMWAVSVKSYRNLRWHDDVTYFQFGSIHQPPRKLPVTVMNGFVFLHEIKSLTLRLSTYLFLHMTRVMRKLTCSRSKKLANF